MAQNAFLQRNGKKSGAVSSGAMSTDSVGTLSRASAADYNQCTAFELLGTRPTDGTSGMPTGTRLWNKAQFNKLVDKTSGPLPEILASGEQSDITCNFYRTAADGSNQHYMTVKFTDAVVLGIEQHQPDTTDQNVANAPHTETVQVQFGGITVTHEEVEGADHFFGGAHMDTLLGSVDAYVRRRLTESTR